MEKLIAIIGDEALKVLAAKYGRTESEVMTAAVEGNPKVVADLTKLVNAAVSVL